MENPAAGAGLLRKQRGPLPPGQKRRESVRARLNALMTGPRREDVRWDDDALLVVPHVTLAWRLALE